MNIELAKKVRAAILKDYKHVDMETWLAELAPDDLKNMIKDAKAEGKLPPKLSCGTVSCIAGRVVMEALPKKMRSFADPSFTACGLLGLKAHEARALFTFFVPEEDVSINLADGEIPLSGDPYASLREDLKQFAPGTKGYARVVAKAIDLCIERNS